MQFAIGADLDTSVLTTIEAIPEHDWKPYKDGSIAETVHAMEKTDTAFRLIVIKRPYKRTLFTHEDASLTYTMIATNRMESPEDVVRRYHQRGECSENRIKELTIDFGMERMPCGQCTANALFLRIGTFAYNLFRLFTLRVLSSHGIGTRFRPHGGDYIRSPARSSFMGEGCF